MTDIFWEDGEDGVSFVHPSSELYLQPLAGNSPTSPSWLDPARLMPTPMPTSMAATRSAMLAAWFLQSTGTFGKGAFC